MGPPSARRAAAACLLILGCGSLAGCAALTDPAGDVGATRARLNAHGHTDDTPATFFFQYATKASDLGTTAALRTPTRGPIPAHTGASGDVSFGADVTGLTPDTTYRFEVCGRDAHLSSDVCGGVKSLTTSPVGSGTVSGNWHLGPVTHGFDDNGSVSATSDQGGKNPRGTLSWGSEETPAPNGGTFTGSVTCLIVNANRATVGAVGDLQGAHGGGDLGPASFLLTVVDDGPIPQQPQFENDRTGQAEALGSAPPDCSSGPPTTDQPLPASIVVHQTP